MSTSPSAEFATPDSEPDCPAIGPDVPEAAQSAEQELGCEDEGAVRERLAVIADLLDADIENVTAQWRLVVSRDTMLASSPSWSRRQFDDHIPEMLSVLCSKMRSWPESASLLAQVRSSARAHSKHRWQQGYDMRSLTREWGHLSACLLEALDRLEPTPGPARQVARSLVCDIILESSSESVSEYARLLQAEAAARARQMEAAIEALREDEKSRGQILREAAHDLRGSLGIVSGSASIIDRSHMDQDDRAEVGRLLRRGVRSLHEMLTDLIDLARLEAGEENVASRRFDASQLLRELGATALPLAQAKSVALSIEGPDELSAWGDPMKVRRVAQNLLLNAIKYTDAGTISLAWAPDGDGSWLLRVSDTGPGLDAAPKASVAGALHEATNVSRSLEGRTPGQQNPAGQPSQAQQTSQSSRESDAGKPASGPVGLGANAPGEGVGLSIVKRLCDLMGASLELDAQPGAGSTFRVLFPRAQAAAST